MYISKVKSIAQTAEEILNDAVSLMSEMLLGKPITVQAACHMNPYDICSPCQSCGIDKGRFGRYCWECGTCKPYCEWCKNGCYCSWC